MSTQGAENFYDIAIVGMAGIFPGAQNVEELWHNLREGVESIRSLSDEDLEAAGVPQTVRDDPAYVKAGAYLDDITTFDATLFGLSTRDAEILDPQQRLFLESSWNALEDAACDPASFTGPIGVYAGMFMSTYLINNLGPDQAQLRSVGEAEILHGNEKDFLAARVAYELNLRGPSVTVQAACSTSLVATHLACQALLNRECDMALAGGVSVRVPQKSGYLWQPGGILSPDGHCRTFDAQAAGTIFGDGVGVVVLRRLADALTDRNQIYGVIKGSAVNNDGAMKPGFAMPSFDGQAQVIAQALTMADIDPETIRYVEAHGTATGLGDPIEVAALTQAYRAHTAATGFCAIGSVKTNLGHLAAAAGVTGLIKTALMLHHRWLVPSLHFNEPNPQIDFAMSPFYVNTVSGPWEDGGAPRRAAVSSFGIGGTNAHLILQEAAPIATSDRSRPWQLIVQSAATPETLGVAGANLAAHLREHPELEAADVAFTLQVGRTGLAYRQAVVARDLADARAVLEGVQAERLLTAGPVHGKCPVAFLFPGQGAQYPGMTRELYEVEGTYREQIDRCCELLLPALGCDLRDLLYPVQKRKEEAAERLANTAFSQPALFSVEYSLAHMLKTWGLRPRAMAGHSIGEYVAACLAGVFSLADALALVAERGRLMSRLPTGAMLDISLSAAELVPQLTGNLALAAVNGPGRCTASGPLPEIEALAAELGALGVRCRRLHSSHAFQSAMTDPILEPFAERVRAVELRVPSSRYLSNLTGTWISAQEATDPDYWVRHLRSPVRFGDNIRHLLQEPDLALLEVGPGRTLSSLVALQEKGTEKLALSSVRDPQASESDIGFLLHTLGRLWLAGVPVDWSGFHHGHQRCRVSLPRYPFARRRYWIDSNSQEPTRPMREGLPAKRADIGKWFYLPVWKQSRSPVSALQGEANRDTAPGWLLFSDSLGLGTAIATRLRDRGTEVITVLPGSEFAAASKHQYRIDPCRPEHYETLLRDLGGSKPAFVVHLWSVTAGAEAADEIRERCFYSLLWLAQALNRQSDSGPLRMAVVANGLHRITGEEELCPEKATLIGPCKVIPQEYPGISCRSIDVSFPGGDGGAAVVLAERIIAELLTESVDSAVAYRADVRWVQVFEPVPLVRQGRSRLRKQGTYLITGGLGGLGLAHAEYLAREFSARLILLGRSPIPPREEWDGWLSCHGEDDQTARTITTLRRFEEFGSEVLVVRADITDREQTEAALNAARTRFGFIHGVIHAAGHPAGGIIRRQSRETAETVLAPKITGCRLLAELLAEEPPEILVLFSSTSAVAGGIGSVDYSAANAFLDAFAQTRRGATFTVVIDWGTWSEVGMAAKATVSRSAKQVRDAHMERAIRPTEGIQAFARILADDLGRVVVSPWDLEALIRDRDTVGSLELMRSPQTLGPRTAHSRPVEEPVPPRTAEERKIAAIWEEVLDIEQVFVHDRFFELGADSLKAIRVVTLMRENGFQLALHDLFRHQTIAEITRYMAAEPAPSARSDELFQPLIVPVANGELGSAEVSNIEETIASHPQLEAVCVVPGKLQGTRILYCFFLPKQQGSLSPKELDALCRAKLPSRKIPSRFIELNELPLLATGEPDRGELVRFLDYDNIEDLCEFGGGQIWFFSVGLTRHPDSWTMHRGGWLQEEINLQAFDKAWDILQRSHQSLHAVLPAPQLAWYQIFLRPRETYRPEHHDLSDLAAAEQRQQIRRHFHRLNSEIRLARWPLFRIALFKAGARYFFLWIGHHLICDVISCEVILDDYLKIYRSLLTDGTVPDLATGHAYRDYIRLMSRLRRDGGMEESLKFWRAEFPQDRSFPDLPADFPEQPNLASAEKRAVIELEEATTSRIERNGRRVFGVSTYVLLCAVICKAIGQWSDNEEVAFVELNNGRLVSRGIDLERVVGFLVIGIPIKIRSDWQAPVGDVAKAVAAKFKTLLPERREHYPLLWREISNHMNVVQSKHSQVGINYLGVMPTRYTGDYLELTRQVEQDETVASLLEFIILTISGKLRVEIRYSTKRLRPETVERLKELTKTYLEEAARPTLVSPSE